MYSDHNDLMVEENQINHLLESGINRIKNITNYNNTTLNQMRDKQAIIEEQLENMKIDAINFHEGAHLENLKFKNIEMNNYLYDLKLQNNELVTLIGLQKKDFSLLGERYNSVSQDINLLYDKFTQSEQIRIEQVNLIQAIQNELDKLRFEVVNDEDVFNINSNENEEIPNENGNKKKSIKKTNSNPESKPTGNKKKGKSTNKKTESKSVSKTNKSTKPEVKKK